jgi:serine/threonine protein kinase
MMSFVEPASGLLVAGKYKLLERIGVGGMSEVYRAENILIGRTVALKLLHPERAGDQNLTRRLFQEAQSVSRIRHPGIVDVLDAGTGETGPFIVMEYLEGQSVANVLRQHGKLGLAATLSTVLPVLEALDAAHAAGVVHRDLKPENVFYATDGGQVTVKLLDFGVAKVLFGAAPQTSTGIVFGTPDYLSPEQANAEPLIDGRSDLFAVGVLLFELLTNQRPFHAPTAVATAYKIAHAKTPRLSDHGVANDPLLDAILTRALQKRPEERYATAAEFAHELRLIAPSDAAMRAALRELMNDERARVGMDATVRASWRGEPSMPTPSRPPSGPRSVPSRFVGQCHVRGLVLKAVDDHIRAHCSAGRRLALLAELQPEHARDFLDDTLQAIVYYDLEGVTRYLDVATQALFSNDAGWCRAAGEQAVTGSLSSVLRAALRPAAASTVLRRVAPVIGRLFDFGLWEVTAEDRASMSVRITDFEPASLALRLWTVGLFDGALGACEPRPWLTIARGDAAFAPQLALNVVESRTP